jgi:hypothetical protein
VATIYKSEHCMLLDRFFSGPGLRGKYLAALLLLEQNVGPFSNTTRNIGGPSGQNLRGQGFPDISGQAEAFDNNWIARYGSTGDAMSDAYEQAIRAANADPIRVLESFWISDDTQQDVDAWVDDSPADRVIVYVRTPAQPPGGDYLPNHGGRNYP